MVQDILNAFKEHKIVVIMRKIPYDSIIPVAQALYEGDIRLIEVTFDQASADGEVETARAIKSLCGYFGEKLFVGAGTVMNTKQVQIAVDSGAKYIISPNTDPVVIRKTVELDALSIPGAFTPTEVAKAYASGAGLVKVFPASDLGAGYIKAIKAPLAHIPLLAVGGIDDKNMTDYFKAGAIGIGIGASILDSKIISEGNFEELTVLAKKYTSQI